MFRTRPVRRARTFGLALAAALALTLTACGDDDGTADDSGGGSAGGGASEAGSDGSADSREAFPATVETEFGEVTIEERPERVVALGWGDAEVALQLGVQPVGASDWIGFDDPTGVGPWMEGAYDEPPEMFGTMELSYEAIGALEPDLILDVHSSGDQERYDRLSDIATTVGVAPGGGDYLTAGAEQLEMIATALGEGDQVEDILAEQDAAFAEVAEAHPGWEGQTVTVGSRTSEGWGAYTAAGSRVEFMTELGFVPNPEVEELADEGSWSVSLSDEQLPVLDADLVMATPIWIDPTEITDDAGWLAIPAVEDGRSIVIDDEVSDAFALATPVARLHALEQLEPLIEEALGE
ncbi:iron-siderophore ABC transporter substrate-binding protein [Georgenia sp. Z1491]|uniref:iron-siderophore ABC transporter substrate-binding protein n=1 Tax=Georgenia sp. Z1491 TaxID=3416707 RepID=UPI003CEBDD70